MTAQAAATIRRLAPATAARLGAMADQLEEEALRRKHGPGELAEALAQANAVRALAGPAGGGAVQCEWTPEDYEGAGDWNTGCGLAFRLDEGGPVENGMKFCYGCGLPLVELPWSDGEEPEEAEAKPPAPTPRRAPRPAEVIDLMAAIKASLAASGRKAGA